jgi:hypothetical protein
MTRSATFEQEKAIIQLNAGDIIKIRCNGKEEEAEFVSSKQVNMICIINDKCYNVPKVCYVEVIRKCEKKVPTAKDIKLKVGELFYYVKSNNAILLSFKEFRNGKIVGVNPINKSVTTVPLTMYGGSVKELAKAELAKAE